MKKIFTIVICSLLIIGMSGCEHNKREFFDTEYAALNIWFGSSGSAVETITYNFISRADMDSVTFYVRLSGVPVDYDRTFTLEAVEGDIGKVDYVLGNYALPAGESSASFPIYFAKPDEYGEFRDSDGYIVFKMKESTIFEQGAKNMNGIDLNRLYVILQNSVTKPWNWDDDTYPYQPLSRYFGTYSAAKYEFMIEVLGLSDFRVVQSTDLSEEADDVITYLQADYFVSKCKAALVVFNADPENIASGKAPLKDEKNNEISF